MNQHAKRAVLIAEPYRSRLIERLCNPRQCCPEFERCSFFGNIPHVSCELQLRDNEDFRKMIACILDLSDLPGWYPLRAAIRTLDGATALKTCELLAARIAANSMVRNHEQLAKSRSFKTSLDHGHDSIRDAVTIIRRIEASVGSLEERIPAAFAVQRFPDQGRALIRLIKLTLLALQELYQRTGENVHPSVLARFYEAALRRGIDELQFPSSTLKGRRYWQEWQDLLDGLGEIEQRPSPRNWTKHAPKRDGSDSGNALRQTVKGKSPEADEKILKDWFDRIGPGAWEEITSNPDQVAALRNLMSKTPTVSPVLSVLSQIALLYQTDLEALEKPVSEPDQRTKK